MAAVTARKLIGKEYDIGIMGHMSKEAIKKYMKKRCVWIMRERKYEVKFVEATKEENKMGSYTSTWSIIAAIEGIEKIEELELDSKRIVFFITEEAKIIDVLKSIEQLKFINNISNCKKMEVR